MINWSKAETLAGSNRQWFEVVLVGLVLLPKRWFGAVILGLLIAGGLLGLVLHRDEAVSTVYQFGSAPVTVASPVPAVATPVKATGQYNLLRSPTINPTRINQVLAQYNSPAVGAGQAIYDLGLRYGIDPAFALAFFIHESSAGTQGVAAITKSIGNIRCTQGYECYQTGGNGAFRRYASWEAGVEDWYKLIKELYIGGWGLRTLDQVIPVYAPSADRNNPASYIQQVSRMVDSWQKTS